jgi:cell wall-associated NlpC family hydrolase
METKKHFKLFKAGRNWCVMAVAVVATMIGMTTVANADVTSDTSATVQIAQVVDNSATTSQASASANTDVQSAVATVSSADVQSQADATSTEVASAQPAVEATTSTISTHAAAPVAQKNGWVNENGHWVYYNNGNVQSGRNYSYLPTINGQGHSWYLVDNGVVQSGVQKWAGTYYDFDANTYQRVNNNYVKSQWGDWYLFGNDGRIQTKVQKWAGTYYYFDPSTYLRVDNDYRQSQWGDWYLFGNDGRIQTKVQKWAGSYYYFDPSTYLRVNNDYRQSQWGNWYLFGNDGRVLSGLQKWAGSTYYFDASTYLKVTNTDVTVNGVKYHLDNNGIANVVNNVDDKVNRALSQQGVAYVWGGNTPAGFDCSGLVQWAYGLGANYRTTYQQTTLGAHHYDVYNAPKGALLFFGSDSAPYHVAISLGNGSYVHAPEPGDVVKIGYSKYFKPSYFINM